MEEYFAILKKSRLFSGIHEEEFRDVLSCLDAKVKSYKKDEFLLRAGDTANFVGMILSGSVIIMHEDVWGNRNILSKAREGQTFATAFALAPRSALNISAVAETNVSVMILNVKRILTVCPSACSHHTQIIQNLLSELAEKNLLQNEKLTHMGQRTTRGKVMSYLSAEAQRKNSFEFDIPFSRQQLADYLAVERSGLSAELSKMQADNLIAFHKNHFILKV